MPIQPIALINALKGLVESEFESLVVGMGATPYVTSGAPLQRRIAEFVEWAAKRPGGLDAVVDAARALGIHLKFPTNQPLLGSGGVPIGRRLGPP